MGAGSAGADQTAGFGRPQRRVERCRSQNHEARDQVQSRRHVGGREACRGL